MNLAVLMMIVAAVAALAGAAGGVALVRRRSSEEARRAREEAAALAAKLAEAQRDLQAQEGRLVDAMDGSRLAMWELDMRTGQVNLSRNWWALMGGVPRESPIPIEQLIDRVPGAEQADCWAALRAVMRGSESFYDVEHRVRRDDGTIFWIRSRGTVIERSADGRIVRMSGTNADITARKNAELALEGGAAALRTIAESLALRVFIVDGKLNLLFANNAATERLDPELEHLLRSRMDELRAGVAITWSRGDSGAEVRLLPHLDDDRLTRIVVLSQPRSASRTPSRNALMEGVSADSLGQTNQ